LQALDPDEDLMSAMARELVEKAGVGESANALWRELDQEREKIQPRSAGVEQEPVPSLPMMPATQASPIAFGTQLLETSAAAKKRKKTALWPTAKEANEQLSLFD
jgi:hypothetical protein